MPEQAASNHPRPHPPLRSMRLRPGLMFACGLALAATFVAVFSESIPFYYEDVPWIRRSSQSSYTDILARIANPLPSADGIELFHRPVEELVLKAAHGLAGFDVCTYRWIKNAALLVLAAGLAHWGAGISGSPAFATLSGVWLVTACPIYQSTLWICDFEIVAHLMIAACLLTWHRSLVRRPRTILAALRRIVLLNILAYVAVKTKGSAAVLPLTVLLSALPLGGRSLLMAAGVFAPLVALAVLPRAFQTGSGGEFTLRWTNVWGFARQLPLTVEMVSFLACVSAAVLLLSRQTLLGRITPRRGTADVEKTRAGLSVAVAWMFSAAALWPTLPSSESRYLAGFLIPAMTLTGIMFGLVSRGIRETRFAAPARMFLLALLAVAIGRNIALDVHFRGFVGGQFVAIQRAMDFAENTYRDSAVFYRYWRPMFYPASHEPANRYVLLHKTPRQTNLYVEPHEQREWVSRNPGAYKATVGLRLFHTPPDAAYSARVSGLESSCFDHLVGFLGVEIREFNVMTMRTTPVKDPDYSTICVYGGGPAP